MPHRIAIAAIAAAALSGAAMAGPAKNVANISEIRRYAPEADLSHLSDAEVLSLVNVIHSPRSESKKRALVRALVRKY